MLGAALMPLNSTMIAVAVPDIGRQFDHDPTIVTQALVTSYLIAAISLQSPGGTLADRLGHARMMVAGLALVGAGAVTGWLAPSLPVLVGARLLIAAGGAVLVPTTVALLRFALPPDRRGRAFGRFGAVMSLAAAIGPLVGGELVRAFGWRSVFAANVPVLLVCAALIALAGPAPATPLRSETARFDWLGTGLLTTGLTLGIVGLRPGGDVLLLLPIALAIIVGFILWELRAAAPLIALGLFRSRHFSAGTAIVAVQNLAMYALLFQVPIVLTALFGLEARETGRLLVSLMIAMVVASAASGRLIDTVGPRLVAMTGSIVAVAGILALGLISLTASTQVIAPLAVVGIGVGLATPAAQAASISAVPEDKTGMAAGVASTMRYLGGIIGVAVMSRSLDASGSHADVVSENRSLTMIFGCALVIGLVCAALLPSRERPSPTVSADARSRDADP
jgi:MFS family permease